MIKKTLVISILFVCILLPNISLGETSTYQPLAPIPGLSDSGSIPVGDNGQGFSDYVKQLYVWGVALTSGLAVLVIIWGGVGYMTSAGGGGIEEAKGKITAAIMGLLLALGSYIILQTINKDLLDVSFELETITVSVGGTPQKFVPTTGTGASGAGAGAANAGTAGQDSNNNLTTAWGDPNAQSMEGETIDGRQTYYASGETNSDSNTDAGLSAYGKLIEGGPGVVGSAASVYYPAGTLVEINGTRYVIDDNNLVKQSDGTFKPANTVLTNNYTVDIYTTNVNQANSQTTNYDMTVLYVPPSKVTGAQLTDIRNNPDKYIE